MNTDHSTIPPGPPINISAHQLRRLFGDWEITLENSLGVWSATRRSADGRHIRVIVAPSTGELAVKLWAADKPAASSC
jgi:hypothetical protein